MNVQPGDLARVVDTTLNNDRIVRIVRPADEVDIAQKFGPFVGHIPAGPYWIVEPPLRWATEFFFLHRVEEKPISPDANLRPIRGVEGDDETLAWAGKPESIKTVEPVT